MSKLVITAEDFPVVVNTWGSPLEQEVRRRITLSVATYAYEIADKPIMTDASWDWLASRIDRSVGTCHPLLDEFFATEFSPMTGMWIHNHPELEGVERTFRRYYNALRDYYERPEVQR